MVKTLENTSSENLIQEACKTFEEKKKLKIYVNRGRSYQKLSIPVSDGVTVMIDKKLREHLLSCVEKKKNPSYEYFFQSSSGDRCYINQDLLDKFTELTRKNHPQLKFVRRLALVDKETDIELFPVKHEGFTYATCDNEFELGFKAKAYIAQEIFENTKEKEQKESNLKEEKV